MEASTVLKRFDPPRSIYLSLAGRWEPVPEVAGSEGQPPGVGRLVVNSKDIDHLAQRGPGRNNDGKREPFVLWAGRVYSVDPAEAERLTESGFGDSLSDLPAPPATRREKPSPVPMPALRPEVEELRERIEALEAQLAKERKR